MVKVAPSFTCNFPVNLYVVPEERTTSPSLMIPVKLLGSTTNVDDGVSVLSLEQLVKNDADKARIPNKFKNDFFMILIVFCT
ncbi:hypothetical protein D3C87_1784010 [compost metagenome]